MRLVGVAKLLALALLACLLPVIALTDVHLAPGPPALVASTTAGALAVSLLVLQPWLVARARRVAARRHVVTVRWHRVIGTAALVLVLLHLGLLFTIGPGDTLFALSPDGPTRARMAVLATVALVVVVALGALRSRLPLADTSWRTLHSFFAVLAVVLGIGHAVLTGGALDDEGTAVLLIALGVGLAGVAAARVRIRTRQPPGLRRSARRIR